MMSLPPRPRHRLPPAPRRPENAPCSNCGSRPHAENHSWCRECKRAYYHEYYLRHAGDYLQGRDHGPVAHTVTRVGGDQCLVPLWSCSCGGRWLDWREAQQHRSKVRAL